MNIVDNGKWIMDNARVDKSDSEAFSIINFQFSIVL